jgi:hypothetical protein
MFVTIRATTAATDTIRVRTTITLRQSCRSALVSEVRAFTEATVTGAAGKASAESVEKGRGDAAALLRLEEKR